MCANICILCKVVAILTAQTEVLGNSVTHTLTTGCAISPMEEHIILSAHSLQRLGYALCLYVAVITDLYFTALCFFGRYEDNAISTSCSINGCRGCVFQYVNTLNFRGGNITNG